MPSPLRILVRVNVYEIALWAFGTTLLTALDNIGWSSADASDFNRPDVFGLFGFIAWAFVSLPLLVVKLALVYILTLGGRIGLIDPLGTVLPQAPNVSGGLDWIYYGAYDVLLFGWLFVLWRSFVLCAKLIHLTPWTRKA